MDDSLHGRVTSTLRTFFSDFEGPAFGIRLWDGWRWVLRDGGDPVCTIVLCTSAALRDLMLHPSQVALGEAFIHRQIEVEGDLFAVFGVIDHVLRRPVPLRHRAMRALAGLGRAVVCGPAHSQRRDRESIAYHYDQPVEFFRPWLGPTLVYSCAYFRDLQDSLDAAQTQKLDLICRKLRLQPGERFLDVGCGWGSLILHAAAEYGVRAEGITLSREQARVTEERIAEWGLKDRCQVRLQDYRELNEEGEPFDKIASVGMAEHVGLKNLATYFAIVRKRLRPGGVFLNHAIARSAVSVPRGHDSFIARFVFPDSALTTLTQTIDAAESSGLEVRDVENLREHYERTLRCWVDGLRRCEEAVRQHVPETTYRIWLLYMAGCAAAFQRGSISVNQVVLSRPDKGSSRLPLTREDWYDEVHSGVGHVRLRRETGRGASMTDVLN